MDQNVLKLQTSETEIKGFEASFEDEFRPAFVGKPSGSSGIVHGLEAYTRLAGRITSKFRRDAEFRSFVYTYGVAALRSHPVFKAANGFVKLDLENKHFRSQPRGPYTQEQVAFLRLAKMRHDGRLLPLYRFPALTGTASILTELLKENKIKRVLVEESDTAWQTDEYGNRWTAKLTDGSRRSGRVLLEELRKNGLFTEVPCDDPAALWRDDPIDGPLTLELTEVGRNWRSSVARQEANDRYDPLANVEDPNADPFKALHSALGEEALNTIHRLLRNAFLDEAVLREQAERNRHNYALFLRRIGKPPDFDYLTLKGVGAIVGAGIETVRKWDQNHRQTFENDMQDLVQRYSK